MQKSALWMSANELWVRRGVFKNRNLIRRDGKILTLPRHEAAKWTYAAPVACTFLSNRFPELSLIGMKWIRVVGLQLCGALHRHLPVCSGLIRHKTKRVDSAQVVVPPFSLLSFTYRISAAIHFRSGVFSSALLRLGSARRRKTKYNS